MEVEVQEGKDPEAAGVGKLECSSVPKDPDCFSWVKRREEAADIPESSSFERGLVDLEETCKQRVHSQLALNSL